MSFDIFVQDLPPNARSVAEIPQDFAPGPIGSRAEIVSTIQELAPWVVFNDPAWCVIELPAGSVEISLGLEDPSTGFALHVRGSAEGLGFVAALLTRLQLRALAPGTGSGFFDPLEAEAAFSRWRQYRDWACRPSGDLHRK